MITNLYYKSKLSYTWDADFLAFWERTSGTPDSWMNAYNLAFIELKNSGLFYKSDAIFLLAGHNSNDSLLNIKNNTEATAHNSPSFTAKQGFKGNGLTSYINTHYNPAVHGENWTINDCGFYVYVYEPNTLGNIYHGGAYSNAGDASFIAADASSYEAINGGFTPLGIPSDVVNIKGNSRSNASVIRAFWNDSFYNLSSNSGSITSLELYLLTINENGTAGNFHTNAKLSFCFGGASLSDVDVQAMKNFNLWWFDQIAAL